MFRAFLVESLCTMDPHIRPTGFVTVLSKRQLFSEQPICLINLHFEPYHCFGYPVVGLPLNGLFQAGILLSLEMLSALALSVHSILALCLNTRFVVVLHRCLPRSREVSGKARSTTLSLIH